PGGSIRLVCLETALPHANLLDRVPGQCAAARTFARRPERAMGGETPPRCGQARGSSATFARAFLFPSPRANSNIGTKRYLVRQRVWWLSVSSQLRYGQSAPVVKSKKNKLQ